jgi:hypothetical protein
MNVSECLGQAEMCDFKVCKTLNELYHLFRYIFNLHTNTKMLLRVLCTKCHCLEVRFETLYEVLSQYCNL